MKSINSVAAIVLLAAALLAAACSGGNTAGGSSIPTGHFAYKGPVGKFKVHIKIPAKFARHSVAGRSGRRSHYLPVDAQTLFFYLVDINGGATGSPGTATPYDFSIPTSGCTAAPDGSGFDCTATSNAPAASDRFEIVAKDAGNVNVLAETLFTISVSANAVVTGSFTLNPVVASMLWAVNPEGTPEVTGSTAPTWTASPSPGPGTYLCSTPPCYDPIVNGNGIADGHALYLVFEDADSEVIVPNSTTTTPAPVPYEPIYLDPSGNELNAQVFCSNADTELIPNPNPVTSATPIAYSVLAAEPTANPGDWNPLVANGANSQTGGNHVFYGPGNASGGRTGFNSPLTGFDTATTGQGTSMTNGGNPIGDGFYGNNIAFVNYDGGGNKVDGSLVWSCVASLASGSGVASATYWFGYELGGISWSGNGKYRIKR